MPGNPLDYWGSDPGNPLSQGAPTWADAVDAYGRLIAQQRQRDIDARLIDPATGWPTPKGAVQSAMNMGMGLGTSDLPGGIRAYHGSPYSFDAFDASKIGTGEGAQAYGHGLYFAENEGVARSYRDALAPDFAPRTPEAHAANALEDTNNDVAAATQRLAGQIDAARAAGASDADVAALQQAHSILTNDPRRITGSMYEVNIGSDPAHFLDWDKPLSEQSQHVQGAVTGLEGMTPTIPGHVTGGQLVDNLQTYHGSPADAAQALRDKGVAGIRYLDAGSRASGEGSHNLVVFDPATIAILRKYGIAGLGLGLGAAATQGNAQQQ